tara:strand:+ start:3827 stop:4078 length:252 start_codon:yes stop_codon:yes gene_type:complete
LNCIIYKATKKANTYLFLENEKDLSRVPTPLLDLLGMLEIVIELEISASTKLAQASTNKVISELKQSGFYLQLPSDVIESKEF